MPSRHAIGRPAASFRPGGRKGARQPLLTCEKSSAALEFALIAIPFFAMLIAIFATGLVFLSQQVLQTATTETARLILTGQAQLGGLTAAQFQQDVCTNAGPLLPCSDIYVNVQTYSSFSSMSMLNPLQNGNFNQASMNYDLGGPGDIVLVQVFYEMPVLAGPLGFTLANMAGNDRLLQATAVFRNEPY
ncbi:MAG: pilus assembly protein [Rhodospirillales bacterium]|nr:pilus assembly protein [Rhodospirillales bacterium]